MDISDVKTVDDLKKLHTKQLLKMLNLTRQFGGRYFPNYEIIKSFNNFCITSEEIKVELATREHVPTGAEAKKIRQQKAKAKKNR